MRSDTPKLRADLKFTPRPERGDVLVVDAVLSRYHAIGEIELAVFREFDGVQTYEQIARKISRRYHDECRPEMIADLAMAAAELGLLDLVSDSTLDGPQGRRIARRLARRLRRAGFKLRRREAARGGRADARRVRLEEAALIDQALVHLGDGRLTAAARALHAVLEIRPDNPRAQFVLEQLQTAAAESRGTQQGFLQFRIPLFAPMPVLRRLDAMFGWLVHPATAVAGAVALLIALLSLVASSEELLREANAMRRHWVSYLWLLVPSYLLHGTTTLMHELAHGLTCAHFGGHVPRIGLLFMGGHLGGYCDVSAAYTFGDRWKRAAVSASGPVFEAWSTALFIFGALATEPGTDLHAFLLLEAVSSTALAVRMVLPFYKDDLYYTIGELLGIENLYEKMSDWLKSLFARLLLGMELPPPQLEPAERRVVQVYGAVNMAFTAGSIALTFGVALFYLLDWFRATGLLLFVAGCALLAGKPARRLAAFLWASRGELLRPRLLLRNGGLFIALAGLAPWIPVDRDLVVPCRVIRESVPIVARASGRLAEFAPRVGDPLEPGLAIARLENPRLEVEEARCRAQLSATEASLHSTVAPASALELAPLRAAVAGQHQQVRFAQQRLGRLRELRSQGASTATELSEAETALSLAQAALLDAELKLRLREAGATSAERETAEAATSAARAACELLRRRVAQLEVASPAQGILLERQPARSGASGEWIDEGSTLGRLATRGPPRVELQFRSYETGWARPGASLDVRLVSDPRSRAGTIVTVPQKAGGEGLTVLARIDAAEEALPDRASCTARLGSGREPLHRHLWRPLKPMLDVTFWTLW